MAKKPWRESLFTQPRWEAGLAAKALRNRFSVDEQCDRHVYVLKRLQASLRSIDSPLCARFQKKEVVLDGLRLPSSYRMRAG